MGGSLQSRRPLGLSSLALAYFYLAGPLLIIWELFRPEVSFPLLLLFMAWVFPLTRSVATNQVACPAASSHFVSMLALLGLCVAWVYLSGIGGYAACRWDYAKHNLVFSFLLNQKLPIETNFEGRDFIFHYSLAYYITPVRVKQLFQVLLGRASLDLILLVTYSAVLFVAVRVLGGIAGVSALILFFVFSLVAGWDVLGMTAFGVKPDIVARLPVLGIGIPQNIEWWGVPGAPQSPTMNLYYAPQHFFAALVGSALVIAFMQSSRPATLALTDISVTVAASAFWSAYVAVGLFVLALLKLIIGRAALLRWREGWLAPLLAPWGLFAAAFAIALAIAAWVFVTAAVPLSPPRLLVNESNTLSWLLTYVLNYAPCIVALMLACWPHAWKTHANRDLRAIRSSLLLCLAASAALLLLTHGTFNDWAMRTTLPLWIVLAIALAYVVSAGLKWFYLTVFLLVLVLSSAGSLAELAIGVVAPPNCAPYGAFSLKDMGPLAFQYQGRRESILYRYLVRPQ